MKNPKIIGRTASGHPIELYSLGPESAPKIVLVGGMHGDEPEGSYFVEDFLKNSEPDTFRTQVLVIPKFNPEGLKANQRVTGQGIDLNRNFPAPDWSSSYSDSRYFPGDSPGCSPEVKSLVEVLNSTKPFLVIHVHTYEPQLNYTGTISQPWADYLSRDFNYPVTDNIGYPTPGSLGQYCHLVLRTACICVELPELVERKLAWRLLGPRLIELAQGKDWPC